MRFIEIISKLFKKGALHAFRKESAGIDISIFGSIDMYDTVEARHDDTIIVRGWSMVNKKPPQGAELFIDGERKGALYFVESRPDILSFVEKYKWRNPLGFITRVNVGKKRGPLEICIRVCGNNGDKHYMRKKINIVSRDNKPQDVNIAKLDDMVLDWALGKSSNPKIRNYPVQAYMEITTACNLSCIMCRDKIKTKDVPTNLFFPMEIFNELKDIFPYMKQIILGGWGEPTLHRNFMDFIRIARKKNPSCNISFTSNFNRLTDEMINAFIYFKVDIINVSIDGATSTVYEHIRKKGSFKKLVDNINLLNKIKLEKAANLPNLSYEFVVQKTNIHELSDFVELVHSFGGRSIAFECILGIPDLDIDYNEHLDKFNEARKKAKKHGIRLWASAYEKFMRLIQESGDDRENSHIAPSVPVNEPASITDGNLKTNGIACYEPFQTTYINPDGLVTPCCLSSRRMGHIRDSSLKDIWFGESYEKFREEMFSGEHDIQCARCIKLSKNVPKINANSSFGTLVKTGELATT